MANLSVGEKISHYRKNKKYTQKKLSDLIGISSSMLGFYEQGKYFPSVDLLRKISEALQLNEAEAADLFGVPSEKEKEKQKQENSFDFSIIFENALHFKAFLRSFAKNGKLELIEIEPFLKQCKFSDEEKQSCELYYTELSMYYDNREKSDFSKLAFQNFINDTNRLYKDTK